MEPTAHRVHPADRASGDNRRHVPARPRPRPPPPPGWGQSPGAGEWAERDEAFARALIAPPDAVTPWQFGAIPGDCRGDASAALATAARMAVRSGRTLWTGGCLAIAHTFVPPPGLVWRSDFMPEHRLLWIGAPTGADAVEVVAPIDLDGVIIDGGRPAGFDRSAATQDERRALLSIHGSLATDAPRALSGVRIGRVRVQNSGWAEGVLAVNVSGLSARRIETRGIWGTATMWAGVADSHIGTIDAEDTGNLASEGGRAGQAVSLFAETDPRKQPAAWFSLPDPQKPSRNILPTHGLVIDTIETRGNTDTAVYVHDYPGGRGGQGIGVDGIRIGSIAGDLVGKDLFKVRHFAGGVDVGRIVGTRIGARIVSVEDGGHDVHIGSIEGSHFGFDAVGRMLGHPAAFSGVNEGRGLGFGQTLTTNAVAVTVLSGAHDVTIDGGHVSDVPASADGRNGYGVQISDAANVRVRLAVAQTAGPGVRVANTGGLDLDVTVADANRTNGDAAVLLADDGHGPVHDSHIVYGLAGSGGGHSMHPIRVSGAAHDLDIGERAGDGGAGDAVASGLARVNVHRANAPN